MNEIISIIVPIYNVEKYLEVCLSSVCNQTYPNLDIVLVDDGSTDQSENIINFWSKKDKRIQALHKKNGGLSDARNFGVNFSKGEFILFLDGDDYLAKDCIEHLISVQNKENSDIVIGAFREVDELSSCELTFSEKGLIINYNNEKAIEESLYRRYFGWSACGNLYRRSVLTKKFPVNRLYEDLAVTHVFLSNANKVTFTDKVVYYYRQRVDSIVHSFNIKRIDYLKSALELESFCKLNYPNLSNASMCRVFSSAINFVLNIDDATKKEHPDLFMKAWNEIKRTRFIVLFTKRTKFVEKSASFLSYFGPNLLRKLWKFSNKFTK